MKKILIHESGKGIGGAYLSMVESFSHNNIFHTILISDYIRDDDINIFDEFYKKKLSRIDSIKSISTFFKFIYDFFYCIHILRKTKPDLVYLNNCTYSNSLLMLVCSLMSIRFVQHFRGQFSKTKITRFALKHCHAGITVAKHILDEIPSEFHGKVTYMYDYVDTSFYNSTIHSNSKEIHIGVFCTFESWKGHEIIVEAISSIVNEINCKLQVHFIGASDYQLEQVNKISKLIIDKKLEKIFKIVPFTSSKKAISSMMDLCDVIVHYPTLKEPFGRVIIEALHAKKVVIASNEGGPAEVLKDGFSGFLVSPRDKAKLASKLKFVIDNFDSCNSIRENAHIVSKDFTTEKSQKALLNYLGSLL
jgi:glycosyltransferase involved in cell wall biosynthesis